MAAVLLANSSVAFAAPPKPAPKPPSAASKSYDEAQRHLAAGNHEAALALDKLGRTDEAIAEYQKFIAAAPPALQEPANTARARVAELSAARTVKVRVVTTPPGAAIEIVGQPPSGKISPADVDLPPGKHVVRATLAASNAASREIEVGSSPQEVSLELTPIGTGPVLAIPASVSTAGALALGTGVISGISALGKQSDYRSDPSEKRAAAGDDAATACACASEPSPAPRYSAAASTVASSSPSASMPGATSSPFASSSRSGRSLMMPTRFSTFMTW